ncbi:chemotaxis protein CheW, partial [Caulobacter sp. S45]|uniref:chemotaxis protein CheW n=1 Tax=Caulobacter sp. S45 TaxID=1641861 RepID=UPI001576650D
MAEPDPGMASGGGPMRRFLTFRVDQRLYALPAEEVIEVIRTPAVARVPQGPAGLLGMANLRGLAAPVASLRGLLGRPQVETTAASRTLVLAGATTIALAVDGVDALVSVDPERVETVQARLGAETGEQLRGAFGGVGDEPVARILDIQALLASAFAQRARPVRAASATALGMEATVEARDANHAKLVTFEVAGQEYAMDLEAVREIISAPADLAFVPHSEALVLGVASYRDTLLPLFSLRGLLGFPADAQAAPRVLVVAIGGAVVGLVADRMRAFLPADPDLIEPTPSIL